MILNPNACGHRIHIRENRLSSTSCVAASIDFHEFNRDHSPVNVILVVGERIRHDLQVGRRTTLA